MEFCQRASSDMIVERMVFLSEDQWKSNMTECVKLIVGYQASFLLEFSAMHCLKGTLSKRDSDLPKRGIIPKQTTAELAASCERVENDASLHE
jgi:hypothetical protein